MRTKVSIEGTDDLRRKFGALERKLQGQILAKAARAAAAPVRDRARLLAPRDTGDLATRGIVSRAVKRTRTYAEFAVGHRKDNFYGVFQELGVSPHSRKVGPRRRGVNYTGRRGGDTRPVRTHPGHPAQPHLRPAFDQEKGRAELEVREVLLDAILEAIRRS